MRHAHSTLHTALLTTLLLCTACGDGCSGGNAPPLTRLQATSSCDALAPHIADALTEEILARRYAPHYNTIVESGDVPDSYSTTPTQEPGLDEADIVKTDGHTLYMMRDNELVIFDTWPAAQTQEIARITLPEQALPLAMTPQLFLHGDTLVVLSTSFVDETSQDSAPRQDTLLTLFDVTERTSPQLLRTIELSGTLLDARLNASHLYLLSHMPMELPFSLERYVHSEQDGLPPREDSADPERLSELKAEARPLLQALLREELARVELPTLLPDLRVHDANGASLHEGALYSCEDLLVPTRLAHTASLSLTHLDLDHPAQLASTGVLTTPAQLYASPQSLYLIQEEGETHRETPSITHLHKFTLSDDGSPRYTASGELSGWVLAPSSLSEHQGDLLVITSDIAYPLEDVFLGHVPRGDSFLTVLEETEGRLRPIGTSPPLAHDASLCATHLSGSRATVLTCEERASLLTLDLHDPRAPQLASTTSLEGSEHTLRSLDDTRLLLVGALRTPPSEPTPPDRVLMQLIDVSDVNHPAELSRALIADPRYEIRHHARDLTYDPITQLLALPITYSTQSAEPLPTTLILYRLDTEAPLATVSEITHADLSPPMSDTPYNQLRTDIYHSLFIEDFVYSISGAAVKVNALDASQDEEVILPFYTLE